MNLDKQTKLPEFVSKKIVEALQQNDEETDILENFQKTDVEAAPAVETAEPEFVQPKFTANREFHAFAQKSTMDSNAKIEIEGLELPDNVIMLINLINQLPAGVSRQTGAQIIRQTIEAMGISMKSVLSEAQYIQEDLGNSAKECVSTIEEYKSNIVALEQKIQKQKQQAAQLGDLINLFVMTIK